MTLPTKRAGKAKKPRTWVRWATLNFNDAHPHRFFIYDADWELPEVMTFGSGVEFRRVRITEIKPKRSKRK